MKNSSLKKVFAVFLAVLISLSSLFAVTAYAYPSGAVNVSSAFSILPAGASDTDENYAVGQRVKPGQKVRVDVYYTTTFRTNQLILLFGYNRDMLTFDVSRSLPDGTSFFGNVLDGMCNDVSEYVSELVSRGMISADAADGLGLIFIKATCATQQLGNVKCVSLYFDVNSNAAAGSVSTFEPIRDVLPSPGETNKDWLGANVTYVDDSGTYDAKDCLITVTSGSSRLFVPAGTVTFSTGVGVIAPADGITGSDGLYVGTDIADNPVKLPAVTPPADKVFDGWSKTEGGTKLSAAELAQITYRDYSPDTLYALYADAPATYKLTRKTMKADGTYESSSTTGNPTTAGTVIKATDVTFDKSKYVLNTALSQDAVASAETEKECIVVLDRKKFSLDWKVNNEQVGTAKQVIWGTDMASVPYPEYNTPEGYKLIWGGTPEVMPAEDYTVAGTLAAKTVVLTLNPAGGTLSDTEIYGMYDSTLQPGDPFPPEGTYFAGWSYTDGSGISQLLEPGSATPPLNHNNFRLTGKDDGYTAALTAEYKGNTYYATLKVDGSTYGKPIAYTYGQKSVQLPAVPAKAGYSGVWESYTLGVGGVTINAVYTPLKYNAVFVADGQTVDTVSYTYGDTSLSKVPSVPAKAGYSGVWESYTLGVDGVTINAVYTPVQYSAVFVADGQTVDTVPYTYGDTTLSRVPSVPAKAGYSGVWESYTLGVGGVTINAVYTPLKYNAVFIADGQTVDTVSYTYGDTSLSKVPSVPAKAGYSGVWESYTLGVDGVTINAVYTPVQYSAVFVADGQTVDTVPYTYGDTTLSRVPSVPAKDGYSGEWESYTLGVGGVTVNAVYTENQKPAQRTIWDIIVDGIAAVATSLSRLIASVLRLCAK